MSFAIKDIVIQLAGEAGCGTGKTSPCNNVSKCHAASGCPDASGCGAGNTSGGPGRNRAGIEILRQHLLSAINNQPVA
jgi:hypothetical protein